MRNNDVDKNASEKLKSRKYRKRWQKIVSAIACVVVFCTVYSLILPAITLEAENTDHYEDRTLYCTLDEHIHTETCQEKELKCSITVDFGHKHNDECYSTVLICDKLLQEAHAHTERCYKTVNELSCQLVESQPHAHTDACYGTESQLTCETAESEGHTHDENCKELNNRLICTKEVADPTHIHTEGDCYQLWGTENLICGQDGAEGHTHSDDCFERIKKYTCTLHVHGEEDGCFKATEVLTCDKEESPGHTHSVENGCYTDVRVIKCGQEETQGHKHFENSECWTQIQQLYCDLIETDLDHSQHEATCYDHSKTELTCGKEESEPSEHQHTDECYEITVLCENKEHTHNGNCYIDIESDDWVWLTGPKAREVLISKANMYIGLLPTSEDFENKLLEFEEAEDWDGYEAYYLEVYHNTLAAYTLYFELTEEEKAEVLDFYKLDEMLYLIYVQAYATSTEYTINMFNVGWSSSTHNDAAIIIGGKKGSTVGNAIGSDAPTAYWSCIVVDSNNIVTDVLKIGDSKSSVAIPYDGYVILRHNLNLDAAIGDRVILSGTLAGYDLSAATVRNYSSSGYGTIAFSDDLKPTDAVKKNYTIPTLETIDMQEKIRVSLYDYSDLINSEWYSNDSHYPTFQNPGGTKVSSSYIELTDVNDFNYGDVITSDTGTTGGVGSAANKINKLSASANRGLNGDEYRVMAPTLINDKPALIDGSTYDLGYLFTHDPSKGVTKMNENNITGLFRMDSETGNYYFDSRQYFAQFNEDTDTFTLYDAAFTPNYLMYPFGNFMPLNKIETTTTKVSEINSQRLKEIAGYSLKLAGQTTGTASTNYNALANNLNAMNNLLVAENPDWAGLDAADYYFAKVAESARPEYYGDETKKAELENKLYNLDYDEESNFFFGMTIDFNFIQPKDGMYKSEHTMGTNLDAMKFNFAGDDDVWVYVDGVLLLDISGIHRHVGGTIDFQTGTVSYYEFEDWDGNVSSTPYLTETFAEIFQRAGYTEAQMEEKFIKNSSGQYTTFKDYTNHTFRMYYMERGSGSSVCSINFNMPVIQNNTVGVLKMVDTTVENASFLGNPWYEFQIFKADVNGNKTNELLVTEGTEFEVFTPYGEFIRTDTVGVNGVFHVKADEIAQFPIAENAGKYFVRELIPENISDQIKFVRVDGMEQTQDTTSGFPALSGFEGFDSNIKDISDGTTIFTYVNQYDVDYFGGLAITKVVQDAPDDYSAEFTFEVLLDGEKLPEGTEYVIKDKDTDEIISNRVIDSTSTVVIGHNQKAEILNIAAGARFSVKEVGNSEYSVTYSGQDILVVGETAVGTIMPTEIGVKDVVTATLDVTNYVSDETVSIPVSKVLNNYDGTERTFRFKLEQVDSTGVPVTGRTNIFYIVDNPSADTAKYLNVSVTAQNGEIAANGTGQFDIPFVFKDLTEKGYTLPTDIYFKITEVNEDNTLVGYDSAEYIVKVPLRIWAGQLNAGSVEITGGSSVVFTNTLLDSMVVSKVVIGDDFGKSFTFTLSVKDGEDIFTGPLGWTKTMIDDGEQRTGTLIAAENVYTFELKNNQTITITGLPVGATYQVTESDYDGYHPSYRISPAETATDFTAGDTVSSTLRWIENGTNITDIVEFENRAGSKLPQTGGIGTTLYTSGGALLAVTSLILGYGNIKRKQK